MRRRDVYTLRAFLRTTSRRWREHREAARRGLPAAQTSWHHVCIWWGVMKATGAGYRMVSKTAKRDFAKAQYQLGVAYSTGRGVPENSRNALKWYLKAANEGVLLRHNQR